MTLPVRKQSVKSLFDPICALVRLAEGIGDG
jgi:hypothetical protein